MHKKTEAVRRVLPNMKPNMKEVESSLNALQGLYHGETAYVLACGPSFSEYSESFLSSFFADKLVIAMKQTFNMIPHLVDFHLLNFCNLSHYEYTSPDTVVFWSVWSEEQRSEILSRNVRADFILDTFKYGDGTYDVDNSLAAHLSFDDLAFNASIKRPWGPGTMYELAIPLAMHLGCKKVVTLGWDLFVTSLGRYDDSEERRYQDHFYNDLSFEKTRTKISEKEITLVIQSTEQLYYWMRNQGVALEISDPCKNNPAYSGIPRVELSPDVHGA